MNWLLTNSNLLKLSNHFFLIYFSIHIDIVAKLEKYPFITIDS